MANASTKQGHSQQGHNRVAPQSQERPAEVVSEKKKAGRKPNPNGAKKPQKKIQFPGARPFDSVPQGWDADVHKRISVDEFANKELHKQFLQAYDLERKYHPGVLDEKGARADYKLDSIPEHGQPKIKTIFGASDKWEYVPLREVDFADPLIPIEAEIAACKDRTRKLESIAEKLRAIPDAKGRREYRALRKGAPRAAEKAGKVLSSLGVGEEYMDNLRTMMETLSPEQRELAKSLLGAV